MRVIRKRSVIAVLAVVAAGAALAQTLPTRRAGWWEQTMTGMGPSGQVMTMHICTDATTEAQGALLGRQMAGRNCSSRQYSPIPGGWQASSTCTLAGRVSTSHATITGDFNSHVHADVTTSGQGGERHMVMDMTWKGACPAGRTPGDVEMPNGMVMNMNAMMGGGAPH